MTQSSSPFSFEYSVHVDFSLSECVSKVLGWRCPLFPEFIKSITKPCVAAELRETETSNE